MLYWWQNYRTPNNLTKGKSKLTIIQTDKISQQPENCENRNESTKKIFGQIPHITQGLQIQIYVKAVRILVEVEAEVLVAICHKNLLYYSSFFSSQLIPTFTESKDSKYFDKVNTWQN
jgi:hypothetical protein